MTYNDFLHSKVQVAPVSGFEVRPEDIHPALKPHQRDAVEVVRCEECLYRSQYSDENGMYHCGGIDTTKDHALPVVAPDFFCAHHERRNK